MIGLTTGNGPISFDGNSTRLVSNPYSWTNFGHVLYVDQPVGTGYSTASEPYPAVDNEVVTTHLYDWLRSFFAHFPHLQSKHVHLIGESWAGIYVPNIATAIINNQDSFPLDVQSMVIGDGSFGNAAAMATISIGKYLKSQKSVIGMPDDVLAVFTEASETCGFNDILEQVQYPPEGKIAIPGNPEGLDMKRRRDLAAVYAGAYDTHPTTPEDVRNSIYSSRYGPCAIFSTAMDYLSTRANRTCGYDVYDISHDCTTIDEFELISEYFGRADVQAALNVLPSASNASSAPMPYASCSQAILGILLSGQAPQPPVYSLLPELVTSHNISLHIYWGEYDMLLNHFGAELVLQNMTWNGEQGFSSPITRSFYADNAAPPPSHSSSAGKQKTPPGTCAPSIPEAGKWISERGVTFHRFHGAGHSVFLSKPREMFAYVRDVVVATTTAPSKHKHAA